jgi:ParB family chromosome partitioning protein
MSQEEIGNKLGLSKPTISNKMRLLNLPEEIKRGLLENKITEGHARALLGLINQDNLVPVYKMILKDNLSVRATEELVRRINKGISIQKRKSNIIIDEYTQDIEKKLKFLFGTETNLFRSRKGGRIVIKFKDDTELNKIIKTLNI